MDKLDYTWEMFDKDIKKLTKLIEQNKYDMLVGIASGGLPLLTKIHNITKLPYEIVRCSSYEGRNRQKLKIDFSTSFIGGKKILIVDDVSDSGETLQRVVEECKKKMYLTEDSIVHTLTLFVKEGTIFWPNWYSRIVDKYTWIGFFWEK